MKNVPETLRYVETHEWVKQEGNQAWIGLTAHAVELLGDVVYLELPAIGDSLAQNAAIGVVESVKAASDIYAPISGKVLEVNQAVISDPSLLNADAYMAWLVRIELSDASELEGLMTGEAYAAAIA